MHVKVYFFYVEFALFRINEPLKIKVYFGKMAIKVFKLSMNDSRFAYCASAGDVYVTKYEMLFCCGFCKINVNLSYL